MALPCLCHKCARCISLESLKDPFCLSVEEENCEARSCNSCDFSCDRYIEKIDPKRSGIGLYFLEG